MDELAVALLSSDQRDTAKQLREYIEGSIDASDTIKSCTAHQKVGASHRQCRYRLMHCPENCGRHPRPLKA